MTLKNFEAVFFDMDGTLVNTEPYWLIAETSLMAEFGYQWSDADQRYCLGGPLPRVGEYMRSITLMHDWQFYVTQLINRVAELFGRGIDFMPGAQDLLRELSAAQIPLALVSASPRILVDATLGAVGERTFSISISSDDVQRSKPDPEPYLKAAGFLGVDIRNCLILEDSITGITAAQSSGAMTLAIPHIVTVGPHPRTIVVETLAGMTTQDLAKLFSDMTTEWITQ